MREERRTDIRTGIHTWRQIKIKHQEIKRQDRLTYGRGRSDDL